MAQPKRIAVLGAGPSGLSAIKACKEEGFLPVCYERNGDPGGLWRYHDEDIEGVASVMRTTIINTSKEVSAFSDFPPPKEYPNYMHNSKMFDYFMSYAEHFNLLRHIRYNLEVIKVEPTKDFDETGRWIVTVKSTQTAATSKEEFDGVLVCVGHHVYPKIPTFPDQHKFKGTITHTHSIKNCDRFSEQRVVVVGIGNSGVDAAVDCTYVAKQVYLSTRRGAWVFRRVGINGRPRDIDLYTRKNLILNKFRSFSSICDTIEKGANAKFDHAAYNLKPKHRALSQHPTVNDNLPNCILSGRIIVKNNIERFEENGIVFVGEDTVTEVDAVIFATGYHIKFPFLDRNIVSTDENRTHLYKYAFPPHFKHPTLAVIGLIQPLGPILAIAEMQSRLFIQILAGKLKLPTVKEMEKDIAFKKEAITKRYVASTRHTIQVDFIPFMDELAEMFGAKPNLLKLAITDPKLFWACIKGPCLSYQYRLNGPHKWDGAREALLNFEERMYAPLNSKGKSVSQENKTTLNGVYLSTRKGSWIFGRVGANGRPSDLEFASRKNVIFSKFKSYNAICDELEKKLNAKFDHVAYNLKPKHRVLSAHPTINDALPNCILSGRVIVKGDIERFEENGIVFVGEDTVTKVDAVILATGYHIKFPFLDKNMVSTDENKIHLYKYSIPPHLRHPTLAVVGIIQPIGPIFPIAEMQCRWFMQLQSGKLKLPRKEAMEKEIVCKNDSNAKRYVNSTRHTVQADWIPLMDELSELIGAKPNFLKLALTDPKLFWACINGPCLPYQYRLQGPHAWAGARDALLNCEERIYAPLNSEGKTTNKDSSKILTSKLFIFLLVMSAAGLIYGRKYLDTFAPKQYLDFE